MSHKLGMLPTQNGVLITRTTDSLGRPSGFSLDDAYAVSYAYDMFGRFHSVTSSTASTSSTYTYSYLPNSDLVSGMSSSSGFLWTRAYESVRSLITAVENRFGETVISRYDYENDELGRRTSRADSGTAFAAQPTFGDPATVEMPAYNAYAYNTRSEVTGAARRWGTPGASGDLVLGKQYAYEFDPIGNRITSAEGDTDRTASYTANALNQYTQRTVPDEKDLIGTAPTNVAVTVNQNPVSRQSAYWHHALEVDNATDAAFPQVAITAVYNPPGTNAPDVVTSQTGHVFVAKTPEAFTYDDDGNLTQDGRIDYTWNGENRLIKAETRDDLPVGVPRVKVEYAYDHQSRMVWKQFSRRGAGAQSWEIEKTVNLIWDGYNIVQALTHSQTHTLTNSYIWGLDLSGSLQGAGGVGGLLAEVKDGVPYYAASDANGNVTEYVTEDGSIAAHREYSPCGETIAMTGTEPDAFLHWFSTKPWCAVTRLSEYEFRKYSPNMGRWLSRDPVGDLAFAWFSEWTESGVDSLTPYVAFRNSAITHADMLGLWGFSVNNGCTEQQKSEVKTAMQNLHTTIDELYKKVKKSLDDRIDLCGCIGAAYDRYNSRQAAAGSTSHLSPNARWQLRNVLSTLNDLRRSLKNLPGSEPIIRCGEVGEADINIFGEKGCDGDKLGYVRKSKPEITICSNAFGGGAADIGGIGCILMHEIFHKEYHSPGGSNNPFGEALTVELTKCVDSGCGGYEKLMEELRDYDKKN